MDIRAVAFDVNGTLVEILTEEGDGADLPGRGHFLTYQGIDLRRHQVRDLYFRIMKEQRGPAPRSIRSSTPSGSGAASSKST